MKNITSKFLRLNWRDLLHGLIMAVGGAVYDVLERSISADKIVLNWNSIWHTALGAAVVYLGKKFFTSARVIEPLKTDQP